MPDAYLLDTNAAIAILNGDEGIQEFLKSTSVFSISVITVGELCYGAERSGRKEANLKRVEEFISWRVILNCDVMTARVFGRIRHQLKLKGHLNQPDDVWIAATALQ